MQHISGPSVSPGSSTGLREKQPCFLVLAALLCLELLWKDTLRFCFVFFIYRNPNCDKNFPGAFIVWDSVYQEHRKIKDSFYCLDNWKSIFLYFCCRAVPKRQKKNFIVRTLQSANTILKRPQLNCDTWCLFITKTTGTNRLITEL